MAGRKSSRSSKTDHVLSLLAGAGAGDGGQTAAAHPETEDEIVKSDAAPSPSSRKASQKDGNHAAAGQGRKRGGTKSQEGAAVVDDGSGHPAQPQQRRVAPPILEVARINNEALSETIREALSENLEQELAQEAQSSALEPQDVESQIKSDGTPPPPQEELPAQETVRAATSQVEETQNPQSDESVPAGQPEKTPAPQPEKTPAPQPENRQETVTPQAASATPDLETRTPAAVLPSQTAAAAAQSPDDGRLPDGSVFLNVMELLVEERIEKYVKLFGLCSCPRCMADVRALALTRLPAKYVVLPKSAQAPMLSMYQAKLDATVIAQVIQACKTVMENPRHQL